MRTYDKTKRPAATTPRPWTSNANRTPWVIKRIGKQLYIETDDQNAMAPFVADMQLSDCQSDEERETTLANADFIVRAVNSYEAMREALEAIMARIKGEYDNPSLLKQGELHTHVTQDIYRFAKVALKLAEGEGA